jgi:hypothetical protein
MSLLTNQSAVNGTRSFWAPLGSGGGGGSSNPTFSNVTVLQNLSASGSIVGASIIGNNTVDGTTGNFVDLNVESNVFAGYVQGQNGQFVSLGVDDSITVNNINLNTINNVPYSPGGGGGSNFEILNCSTLNAHDIVNTSTLNVNTINGSAYPPPSGGIGGSTDVTIVLSNNGTPEFFGQNRYFNTSVAVGNPQPILEIDPTGGTVGGNWIQVSPDSVGDPPILVTAQGSVIDVINANAQSVFTYIYSGAGNSIQLSGWHRIGSVTTPLLDDTMATYPFQVMDSNMLAPVTVPFGDYSNTIIVGGNQSQVCFSGFITYVSGAQSPDDFVYIANTDATGKQPVGGIVHIPEGYTTSVPISFTGLKSLSAGNTADVQHFTYQIITSNAQYAIEINNAVLVQL